MSIAPHMTFMHFYRCCAILGLTYRLYGMEGIRCLVELSKTHATLGGATTNNRNGASIKPLLKLCILKLNEREKSELCKYAEQYPHLVRDIIASDGTRKKFRRVTNDLLYIFRGVTKIRNGFRVRGNLITNRKCVYSGSRPPLWFIIEKNQRYFAEKSRKIRERANHLRKPQNTQ
jgi:hypothetical protein